MYLAFYWWVWGDRPDDEVREVRERLVADSVTARSRDDYSVRYAVLAICALWAEVVELAEAGREHLRAQLEALLPPGRYPELDRAKSQQLEQELAEMRKKSADDHAMALWLLRSWPRLPGWPG